jgi:hypothetical protein
VHSYPDIAFLGSLAYTTWCECDRVRGTRKCLSINEIQINNISGVNDVSIPRFPAKECRMMWLNCARTSALVVSRRWVYRKESKITWCGQTVSMDTNYAMAQRVL